MVSPQRDMNTDVCVHAVHVFCTYSRGFLAGIQVSSPQFKYKLLYKLGSELCKCVPFYDVLSRVSHALCILGYALGFLKLRWMKSGWIEQALLLVTIILIIMLHCHLYKRRYIEMFSFSYIPSCTSLSQHRWMLSLG